MTNAIQESPCKLVRRQVNHGEASGPKNVPTLCIHGHFTTKCFTWLNQIHLLPAPEQSQGLKQSEPIQCLSLRDSQWTPSHKVELPGNFSNLKERTKIQSIYNTKILSFVIFGTRGQCVFFVFAIITEKWDYRLQVSNNAARKHPAY